MDLTDVINKQYCSPDEWSELYKSATPFPHIVFDNFLVSDLAERVLNEFPDLSTLEGSVKIFDNAQEVKLASVGMHHLSPSAFQLISYLNSDLFMRWLAGLTGIREDLLGDSYLSGGGYHEIKVGGLLKIHADFNKHPMFNLDRRLNLLLYLNKDWDDGWGGDLQLFGEGEKTPGAKISPIFNRAVIFSTTSRTFHGHPDPLRCPPDRSRKSLAMYFFSDGRPSRESDGIHSTRFVMRGREGVKHYVSPRALANEVLPPFLFKFARKIVRRVKP